MEKNAHYLGIDVGSVSTNLVVIDENDNVIEKLYLRTSGQPINVLRNGMMTLIERFGNDINIKGVGTTGSGRQLTSVIVGADIINGLCKALVRNYLNNLAKGKNIEEPIVFQGGVAANVGIVAAFERALDKKVIIPKYHDVMGAYGAALIAKEKMRKSSILTNFYGFESAKSDYKAKSIDCQDCSNMCEVIEILANGQAIARWGDRCGKWSQLTKVV